MSKRRETKRDATLTPRSPRPPWQVAAGPHGAAPFPSRKRLRPKRLIRLWKPLIPRHVWLRQRPRSLPAALPRREQSHPHDLFSQPQTTPFPQPCSCCSTQNRENPRDQISSQLTPLTKGQPAPVTPGSGTGSDRDAAGHVGAGR